MKIRPKTVLYALTGVKFTPQFARGAGWFLHVFMPNAEWILNQLKSEGETDDFLLWLNNMQSTHSKMYKAANKSGDWEETAYYDPTDTVRRYLHEYRGTTLPGEYLDEDIYVTDANGNEVVKKWAKRPLGYNFMGESIDLNENAIRPNFYDNRYDFGGIPRTSGDNATETFEPDNLYSAITDDRRLLGRKGDWTQENLEVWERKLNPLGYTMFLDKDNYYKIGRLSQEGPTKISPLQGPEVDKTKADFEKLAKERFESEINEEKEDKTSVGVKDWNPKEFWGNLQTAAKRIFNDPNFYETARLTGALISNEKIYNEALKGIRPELKLTYNTHRQVVGDEATKLAYYRRAAEGLTQAALPFTSDADRQMAYLFEAKRVGDELRALGDLEDNKEIRRTSEESNKHQWANTLRATEVANANVANLVKTNALKHNLLAQKYAANHTSFDNFLKGIAYRKGQDLAENKAIWKEIQGLRAVRRIENDLELNDLRTQLDKAKKDPKNLIIDEFGLRTLNLNSPTIKDLRTKIKNRMSTLLEEIRFDLLDTSYSPFSFKSGSKITHKKKDDLLYKQAKDSVEHFRKMSKLSSDALNRKTAKIEKLAPHPKGSTRKYLLGGLAPFVVYTPVALGGETTTSSETHTSSTTGSKSDKKDETTDLLKELFKTLSTYGLPSDTNVLYSNMMNLLLEKELFGGELSTDDIQTTYVLLLLKANIIKYNKELADKIETLVYSKKALNEIAIDPSGKIVVQDSKTHKISLKDWKKLEKTDIPLSNSDLLNMRAYTPAGAFNNNLLSIASNATSIEEVAAYLKENIPTIESNETVIEGYTKKDSDKIKEGLRELLAEAPDGSYKYSITQKTNSELVKMAMAYLYSILPNNMKTLLDFKSLGKPQEYIMYLLNPKIGINTKTELDAVTGRAAKDTNGNSKSGSEELKLDAPVALINGTGYLLKIELNPESSYSAIVNGRYTEFLESSGKNMGAGITLTEASRSTLKGVLDWNKASLGGSKIIQTALDYIVINNGEVVGVDLPVNASDPNTPDFERLKDLLNLDKELQLRGIEDTKENWQKVNAVCLELEMAPKYVSAGKLNEQSWRRFAAFLVTAPDFVLTDKSAILDETIGVANGQERSFYEGIILKNTDNKNFELSSKTLLEDIISLAPGIDIGRDDELYKGTMFIPVKESNAAAALSGGLNLPMDYVTNLTLQENGYDVSKVASYKKPQLPL